jgi:hypothetical protein
LLLLPFSLAPLALVLGRFLVHPIDGLERSLDVRDFLIKGQALKLFGVDELEGLTGHASIIAYASPQSHVAGLLHDDQVFPFFHTERQIREGAEKLYRQGREGINSCVLFTIRNASIQRLRSRRARRR